MNYTTKTKSGGIMEGLRRFKNVHRRRCFGFIRTEYPLIVRLLAKAKRTFLTEKRGSTLTSGAGSVIMQEDNER